MQKYLLLRPRITRPVGPAATATARPELRPARPTKTSSLNPAPAGTGTARKPIIRAETAAKPICAGRREQGRVDKSDHPWDSSLWVTRREGRPVPRPELGVDGPRWRRGHPLRALRIREDLTSVRVGTLARSLASECPVRAGMIMPTSTTVETPTISRANVTGPGCANRLTATTVTVATPGAAEKTERRARWK